jgi:hypothetical protein
VRVSNGRSLVVGLVCGSGLIKTRKKMSDSDEEAVQTRAAELQVGGTRSTL